MGREKKEEQKMPGTGIERGTFEMFLHAIAKNETRGRSLKQLHHKHLDQVAQEVKFGQFCLLIRRVQVVRWGGV